MRLSQEAIRRMINGRVGSGGGGGGSFDPAALAGLASQAWVEEGYISKAFWNELFIIHKKVTTVVMNGETEVSRTVTTNTVFEPNEVPSETSNTDPETGYVTTVTTEVDNIEAKKGFWTNYFLSVLGLNASGGGGGGGSSTLAGLLDVDITNPSNGQALIFNTSLNMWVNSTLGTLTLKNGQTTLGTYSPTASSTIDLALTGYLTQATADERYLKLTGGTMTGNISMQSALNADNIGVRTGSALGLFGKLGYPESGNGSVGGIGFMYGRAQNGQNDILLGIYITSDPTKDPYSTVGGLYVTADDVLWKGSPLMKQGDAYTKTESDNKYLPLSAGSSKALTGSLYFSSRAKGVFVPYTIDDAVVNIPLIYENGSNLWIGAQATDSTHHTGSTYISSGSGETYVSRLINGTRINCKVLDERNTYVSSGKGYVNGTEITTISGNAGTASRLQGSGTYTAWGQTYWQNGVPQSVVGDLRMLPSGGNTNSDSAKIEFRTLANNDEYIYGPYIQAIYVDNYGRKRLSVFQKSVADWTTEQTEVFTIWPNGTVGIATSTPNTIYKLDVAGYAKAGRLYLSDSIYMVVENNGVHIVGGGLYADTYVSALGLNDSGGASSFDESAMWEALGTTIIAKDISLAYIQSGADTRYALKGDIPSLTGYLPLTAGSSKKLTGSLYLDNYGMGVYVKDPANNYIPVFYQNSQNLWIGATQTSATHHRGETYISAGHNGTSGNTTIYICVPNAANNGGSNYGVLHDGNYTNYVYSKTQSDGIYLKLSGGTLTGLLSIATGLGIQDVTGNGLLCYHPTSYTGVTSSQWGVGAVDSQGVIRSNANDLKHYRGGTLYNILDSYNSSILDSTVTINGTSINAVRYLYLGTDNLNGYLGSFFFGGDNTIQTGYDYVGFQAGNSLDKWQMVAIDSLKWRQNDSGGTDSTYWSDWKVLLDSVNFANYARPKNRVQQTGINEGWYQVATVITYSSLLLAVGGGWNNVAPTLATFYITHHHTTDYITQVGTSYLGFVSKVRIRRISNGYIAIDLYVSRDTSSIICAEVISLDSRPTIAMTQFETPTEGTSVAEVDVVGRDNFGYLPLSGGTLTGNLVMSNACYVYCKTTDGTANLSLGVNSSDQFFVGFGPAGKGCDTYVDGNNLYLRYGTSRTAGILLNSSGNVGVGTSSPSYKLHVNGSAKVSDLWIGDIHITYDSTNGGLYIGGGLAASTYLSALGTNAGGGSGVTLNEPLVSINNAGLGSPSGSGVAIVWNGSSWTYGTTSSGSVTSVGMSVPTGFRVSSGSSQTITSSGTFALTFASGYSLPTTAKQSNWDTAYSASHSHDNMSVLNGITSTKVSNWDTAYNMRHSHDNLTVLNGITSTKVSNWDTAYTNSHTHSNKSVLDGITSAKVTKWDACVNSSEVTSQMQNYAYISSGVIHIGDSSITPLTSDSGTFWGQSWSSGGTVSGNMSNVGDIAFSASGKNIGGMLYFNTSSSQLRVASNATISTFTHASSTVTPKLYVNGEIGVSGGLWAGFAELYYSTPYIDFHYGNSTSDYTTRVIENESGILSLLSPNVCGLMVGGYSGDYVQIGQIRIVYDYSNNALKVMHSNGGAANLYAMGGISALGISSGASGQVSTNLLPSATGTYDLGSSSYKWRNLYLAGTTSGGNGFSIITNYSGYVAIQSVNRVEFGSVVKFTDCVGIGSYNSSYDLYVNGENGGNAYLVGSISASNVINRSDMRLKNFVENTNLKVDAIAEAPSFKFTFKDGDSRLQVGTSAQYWRGVLPESVFGDADGMLGLDYGVTALVSVISVARKVMTHEERIKALEDENKRLRNEIETLKAA